MISINRVNGEIGINTTNPKQYIAQPSAELMIDTESPKIEIHTEPVKVLIDQGQCFNESGLMDNGTLAEDVAQRGRQAAIEGIGRRVFEGNFMASVESGGKAIPNISFNNSFDNKEFNMVTMPGSRPKIEVVGGTVDIRIDEGKVSTNAETNPPIIDVVLGDVEIFLKQEPSISFKFVDNKLDTKV
ncbi:MAG TPA: DUF6470 family protein [Clostridia bacterium]|nr:DUF6470 family protein [Clostridia bacterium]